MDESRIESCMNISLKENETVPFDETIMDNVTIEKVTNTKSLNEITAVALISQKNNGDYLFLGGTKCFLRFQTKTQDVKIILSDSYQGLKSIHNLDNYM